MYPIDKNDPSASYPLIEDNNDSALLDDSKALIMICFLEILSNQLMTHTWKVGINGFYYQC